MGALRDANLDVRPNKNYEIKFGQKDERWLSYLSYLVMGLYQRHFKPSKNMLRITDKGIVLDVAAISGMISPQSQWGAPLLAPSFTFSNLRAYISGFFDAEGGLPLDPRTATQLYVSFDQKNKPALSFIRNELAKLGFIPTNLTYTGQVWQFRLTRKKCLIKFCSYVQSKHPSKKQRLERLRSALLPELAGAHYKERSVRFNLIPRRASHQRRRQNEGQVKGLT